MKRINLTPTWSAILPLLVEVAANGKTPDARAEAMAELQRLARTVDENNKPAPIPRPADDTWVAMNRMLEGAGGGFAQKLAAAWFHADSSNKARIEQAFDDLIERFA